MATHDHPIQILTINSGSSSVKFALIRMSSTEVPVLSGQIDRIGTGGSRFRIRRADGAIEFDRTIECADHERAFATLFDWLHGQTNTDGLDAVGHRIVHGGIENIQPCLVTPKLIATLRELVPLAPEHLPHAIKAIEAVCREYADLPQTACFDTAFHRQMPPKAQNYALPRELRDEGVLRYGFHGLSYEYILTELRKESPQAANGRVVIAHLGNGASMAAIKQGVGVDTTMGFTPAGGLTMSTRSGDLDPGVLIYLLGKKGLSATDLNQLVNRQAGLLGVSGISSDVKDLLEIEGQNPHAAEAIELFCYQAKKFLGALSAVLGGLDTLVFTGGIGEHAPSIRWRICDDLAFLGIHLDRQRNDQNAMIISPETSPVTIRVMSTNEELMIARHTANLLRKT